MDQIINFTNANNQQELDPLTTDETKDLACITDNILLDVRADIQQSNKLSVPIAQLSTLGSGVASMLPAFRTVTQTTSVNTTGLYRWINEGTGNVLKIARNGNAWGAYKAADGASKMAQFQAVDPLNAKIKIALPIDPATMMMAVALFSIEQQLGKIAELQKQILSFLEIEKESEIEAKIETLSSIIAKYKHNWDNEHFISSNHKKVIDIQDTARKHMISYQKRVKAILKSKQIIVLQSKIKSTLDDLQKSFKYYRLSLFTFSLSSLIEIMLSGNFKEENITTIKNEIEKLSFTYRELYSECSLYLENMEKSSVESNLLKGVGATSKAVGKLIGSIPVIKEGQVDEFLQDSGKHVNDKAISMEKEVIESFAKMSNPGTNLFTEKMQDLIQIYNHTSDILFDNSNIYLIAN